MSLSGDPTPTPAGAPASGGPPDAKGSGDAGGGMLEGPAASFGLSFAAASLASALLVIAKELSPDGVMPWMKRLTGHHWASHSALALALFLLVGFALGRARAGRGPRLSARALAATVLGGAVGGFALIAGFYVVHG